MVDSVKCGTTGDHPQCPHTTRTIANQSLVPRR
jgi:hypothetical protein